jgi:hypothetical protein
MKVFSIQNDVNNYQYFLTSNTDESMKLIMNCHPLADKWKPPEIFIYQPKLKRGNFFNFSSGILIVDEQAKEVLIDHLEAAGEILPLPHKQNRFWLLNVTECINCLNEDETEWKIGKQSGKRIGIKNYQFYPDRFSESDLFKIPETSKAEILYVEGQKDYNDSFRYAVEYNGLEGLIFKEIWRK